MTSQASCRLLDWLPSSCFMANGPVERSQVRQHLDTTKDNVKCVQNLFQILLGRSPLSAHEVMFFSRKPAFEIVSELVKKQEFQATVKFPLEITGFVAPGRFCGQPTDRLAHWTKSNFDLERSTIECLDTSDNWREILRCLWDDAGFYEYTISDAFTLENVVELREGLSVLAREIALPSGAHPQLLSGKLAFINTRKKIRPDPTTNTIDVRRKLRPIRGLRTAKGQFEVLEHDPQFVLQHSISKGSYVLYIDGDYTTIDGSILPHETVKLYISFDGTFSEKDTLTFNVSNGKLHIDGILQVSEPIETIRFDPCDQPCRFVLSNFEISTSEAKQNR